MADRPSVGLIGLGIMGTGMAKNLLKAGYRLSVYNRTQQRAELLAEQGAGIAESPKKLAIEAEVIMIIVTDPAAVWDVVKEDEGVFAAPGWGRKTIIQLSTLDVETTCLVAAEAEKCGYRFVDCPVTGSKKQVDAGELILEAGADKAVLDEVRPILSAIGKHIVHAGPIGSGTALKLCMNLLVSQMTTGLCEAVSLARTLNVDPAQVFEVLEHSPALNCVYYQIKREPLLARNYTPAFSLANMLKDVRFMNSEAGKRNLALPVCQAVEKLMEEVAAAGHGADDLAVLAEKLTPSR